MVTDTIANFTMNSLSKIFSLNSYPWVKEKLQGVSAKVFPDAFLPCGSNRVLSGNVDQEYYGLKEQEACSHQIIAEHSDDLAIRLNSIVRKSSKSYNNKFNSHLIIERRETDSLSDASDYCENVSTHTLSNKNNLKYMRRNTVRFPETVPGQPTSNLSKPLNLFNGKKKCTHNTPINIFDDESFENTIGMHIVPHTLYNILAVSSPTCLCLVTQPHLNLIEIIFHSTASKPDDFDELPTFPIRLNDALYYTCDKESLTKKTKDEFSDRLLSISWHRESLTLAVGTLHAVYIIKPSSQMEQSLCNFNKVTGGYFRQEEIDNNYSTEVKSPLFVLAFSVKLEFPCYTINWIHDDLLTKGTNGYSSCNDGSSSKGFDKNSRGKEISVMNTQFFVWKCKFQRGSDEINNNSIPPVSQDLESNGAALFETQNFFEGDSLLKSFVAKHWKSNEPLASFISCNSTPSLSWRCVIGSNTKMMSPVPLLQPTHNEFSNLRDTPYSGIFRLVAHPAGRFLAVLYTLGTNFTDVSSQLCVTSPIVRIWCLHTSKRKRVASCLNEKSLIQAKSKVSLKSFLNFTTCFRLKHVFRQSPPTKTKNYREKKSSCFQRPNFHINRRYFLFFKKKQQRFDFTRSKGKIFNENANLQGPELSILRQLTSVKDSHNFAETFSRKHESANGFKRRISLLKFIATQRLASDEELRALCRMTMPDNSAERELLVRQNIRCQSLIEEKDYIKNSMLVKAAQNFSLQKASGIFEDGPYVSMTLLHRAPVVDLVWKDTGPVADVVFVPAVICSLTADNCLTIWLESSLQMPLQFDPVVVLRLRFNPLKKLIPLVNICHSSSFSQSTNKEDLSISSSTLITKSGLTLCWLTAHHVSLETYQIDNILRFCRVQAFAENTDFNVYEAADIGMDDTKLCVEKKFLDEVVHSQPSSQPLSSFCEKTFEDYYRQKYFSTGLSLGPNGHLDTPSVVELSKEITKKQAALQKTNQEFLNAKKVSPKNITLSSFSSSCMPTQVIDFVLVAESCTSTYLSSENKNGLWVYAFRDLGRNTLSTADPTVKELLSPRHMNIPCRISHLVSAKCIPSLGLKSCLWGDTNVSGLWGEPITVQDGILFPASYVTIVTCSAEIWTCAIKPYIISYQLSSKSLEVQYQVTVISIYGQCVSICPRLPLSTSILPDGRLVSQTPTQARLDTESSVDGFSDCSDPRLLPNVYWKLIEEHRFNSFCLLALDSDGKLFFGDTSLTKRSASIYTTEELVWRRNSTYCFSSEKSFLSPIDTMKFSSHGLQSNTLECFQPDPSPTFSSSFSESNNSSLPDNILECGYSMKALVCLNSLATHWLEDNLVCQLQRTTEDPIPPSSFIPFPELDYAAWLPIMGEPSIMLGVTRAERYLLALQILPRFLREKPLFTVLPFHGTLEPCFDAVQAVKSYLVSSLTGFNEKRDTRISVKKTSIVSLHMFPQTHNTCLIFLRIRTTDFLYEKNDFSQKDTLLLMRCFKSVYKLNHLDLKTSFIKNGPCLMVNTVFMKTIAQLHECIWKSPHALGVTNHETDSYLRKSDLLPEPICCCSPCCFSSTSNAKGLIAMFCVRELQEFHNTVQLCDGILVSIFQFDESLIQPLGFAHVPQKYFQSITREKVVLDNMIVSIALQEETLCILTSIGFILLFELCDLFLDSTTPESMLSLCEKFCETNPHITVSKPQAFGEYLTLPVLHPSTVLDLGCELTRNLEMLRSKKSKDNVECYNSTTLPVEVLGHAPYLSFQCTKGNGLLLLVTLKLFFETQYKASNVSNNYYCVPFIYARRIGVNNSEWIECHLSNLHQLYEGVPNPLQGELKERKCCFFRHVSWGAGSSELLLGRTCEENERWTVQAFRPPITLKLPETLLKQASNMFVELEPSSLGERKKFSNNSSIENSLVDPFDIHSCLRDDSYLEAEELKLLINYLDIKNPDNRWYLQSFGVLVPHLTLLETIQLYGILQFLMFVFQVKNDEALTLSKTTHCIKQSIFTFFASFLEGHEKYPPTTQPQEMDFPPRIYLMGYTISQCVSISLEEACNFAESVNQETTSHPIKSHTQTPLLSHYLLHTHTSNIGSLLNHCIQDSLAHKTDQNYQPLGLTTCDVAFAIQTTDTKELFQNMCFLREQLFSFIKPSLNKDLKNTFLTWKDVQQARIHESLLMNTF
ncbi:uncharacterized protein LOC128883581 [Hylaeus volcanicus]|uniref:uncharacterized protein LOC128883581 n=1 Tax=Hylaeus volcanicus TaxID=313075 RepID=UPI0023B7947D|nr:uncharacterized protein LOC128883581 [Hylaeus volcanicus]